MHRVFYSIQLRVTNRCVYIDCGALPTVTVEPKVLRAVVGDRIQINCTTPEPTPVEWQFRGNGSISRMTICTGDHVSWEVRDTYKCKNHKSKHIIRINQVSFDQCGTYTCMEDEGKGPDYDTSQILVLCELCMYLRIFV